MMTDYISKEVACKGLYESLKLELPDVGVAPIRHGRWEDEFKEDAEAFMKHRYV